MKRIIKVSFVLAAAAITLLAACKKEGCTDTNAVNYNEEANTDDGSCMYNATAHFWMDATTSQNLQLVSISGFIDVYLDGLYAGTMDISAFSNTQPPCGNGGASFTHDLGSKLNNIIQYDLRYTDQFGQSQVFQDGTMPLSFNDCSQVEVEY